MRSCAFFLAFLLATAGAGAQAQQVELHGRIIDDLTALPVVGAAVQLQNHRGRVLGRQVSDDLGKFHFTVNTRDPVRVHAEHASYTRTISPPLTFEQFRTVMIELRMAADVVVLAPLEVVARYTFSVGPTLSGFEQRRLSGVGTFITREEIQRRRPNEVSDLLSTLPGLWLQANPAVGNRRIVYMRRGASCPAQIFVDGFHMNRATPPIIGRRGNTISTTDAFPIDDMVKPGSVHGIEIYPGAATVPPEFRTPNMSCGVIAIWTRRSS
jgi:hypothetical protein